MAGFGSVVGFMFSFFVIVSVFVGAFLIYHDQLSEQSFLLKSSEKQFSKQNLENYALSNPHFSSGRITLDFNNSGTQKLFFKEENQVCFSLFVNDTYVPKNSIYGGIEKGAAYSYTFLDKGESGILSFESPLTTTDDSISLKAISCGGNELLFQIDNSNWDWYDSNWQERKMFNVSNPSTQDIYEYQIETVLNETNFDFSLLRENEIRFSFPLKEVVVLDLPLDSFSQQLTDFSKNSLIAFLGISSGVEASDPQEDEISAVLGGLTFSGSDQVRVVSDSSLELQEEFTYALWVNWDGTGGANQELVNSGETILRIINDGGVNDNKVYFEVNVSGTTQGIFSSTTLDSSWHFITAEYTGEELKLFIDGVLVANQTQLGSVSTQSGDVYIGSDGTSNFFTGNLDEIKIYPVALTQSEIQDLFANKLLLREMNFYISNFDSSQKEVLTFVKVPFIAAGENVVFYIYYDNRNSPLTASSLESTFSYSAPRTVGFVGHDRISGTTGLNIFSLYDNNSIIVGDDTFSLNELSGTTLAAININLNDTVEMKSLAQVEGNGDVDDIIIPLSWAGQEFNFRGFRNANDRFCMISPWGTANVEIFDAGVSEFTGTVDNSGSCVTNDITTANALTLTSDIPILVSYSSTTQDAFPFYPATSESLYGSPSQTIYVASGPLGASINWTESDSDTNSANLGAYGTTNQGGNGADGNSPAFKVNSNNPIGVIQQADGDGSESTVFVPKKEFGIKFGSHEATDYVSVVSDVSDANCTVYDSTNTLVGNVPTGTGVTGIYKYDFGVGNDNQYVGADWKLECSKPVWPFYENRVDNDDETNLFGHLQMRQYVYPEPVISIN